jgi:D-alanyl-D-alanine carboxypeptidase/D-alanyl-D-alanine-endopeptidase (penicillin-binding protein 4)
VPLVPASIQKAVTTATLLRTAGKDWAYHTRAYVDGDVERGVLEGNVVVVGSGDPTLNSSKLPLTPDFVADVASAALPGR